MAAAENEERRVLTIIWKMENMELLDKVNMRGIGSSHFRARILEGKKCMLSMRPKGVSRNEKNINLELYMIDEDPLDFKIDCEWSFLGSNELPLVIGTMRNNAIGRGNSLIISDCPTYEEVFMTRKSAFFSHDTLNIRFRIWKSDGNFSADEFISCRSKVEAMDHTFLWAIPRFSALQLKKKIITPVRFGNNPREDNFLLNFSLEGESLEFASISVELTPKSFSDLFVDKFKISVLNNEQSVISSTKIERKSFSGGQCQTCKLPAFVSRHELLRKKTDCLKNDALNLRCEWLAVCYIDFIDKYYHGFSNLDVHVQSMEGFSTLLDAKRQPSEQSVEQPSISLQRKDNLILLGEDLLSLYREQSLSDFELRSGGASFPVHKIILSARSPVFKAMFSSGMKESDSDSQDVPDLDVHTLNRMLTFLYGGTVEPDLHLESVAKLYYAADKYQVECLKQQCSSIIQSVISVSNVSDILTLADRHRDEQLRLFVYDFFLENFDEIIKSEEWEAFQLREPALAGNIVLQICKKRLDTKRL